MPSGETEAAPWESNSVEYWYAKAVAYGNVINSIWVVLRDNGALPDGVRDVATTLRAHIERGDACLKAAHERADKHANARFALQRRAEAAEQRVAALEAAGEAVYRADHGREMYDAMGALRAALDAK